jgi:hypothetical protein
MELESEFTKNEFGSLEKEKEELKFPHGVLE